MAATTTPRPDLDPRTGTRAYDAFVSYSHAADGRLAPACNEVFSRLPSPGTGGGRCACSAARPASASPELWSAIEEALSRARYFVLLASPEAAASRWVSQEVRWWRENRSHDTVLIVLTDGELDWDDGRQRLQCRGADPARPQGLVPARAPVGRSALSAKRRPRLDATRASRDCVGELAAPMHDLPKDELIGEDIGQHRRTLRLAGGGGGLLVLLLALAVVGGIVALLQRNEAIAQKQRAQSEALRDVEANCCAQTVC